MSNVIPITKESLPRVIKEELRMAAEDKYDQIIRLGKKTAECFFVVATTLSLPSEQVYALEAEIKHWFRVELNRIHRS